MKPRKRLRLHAPFPARFGTPNARVISVEQPLGSVPAGPPDIPPQHIPQTYPRRPVATATGLFFSATDGRAGPALLRDVPRYREALGGLPVQSLSTLHAAANRLNGQGHLPPSPRHQCDTGRDPLRDYLPSPKGTGDPASLPAPGLPEATRILLARGASVLYSKASVLSQLIDAKWSRSEHCCFGSARKRNRPRLSEAGPIWSYAEVSDATFSGMCFPESCRPSLEIRAPCPPTPRLAYCGVSRRTRPERGEPRIGLPSNTLRTGPFSRPTRWPRRWRRR